MTRDDRKPPPSTVATDGGPFIQGNVQVEGDFVARDKIEITNSYGGKEHIAVTRTAIYPVTIAGRALRVGWLILTGILGLAFSTGLMLYTLMTLIMQVSHIYVASFMLLFSALALFDGLLLHTQKFVRVLGMNWETDAAGRIYRTNIEGQCPKCGAPLRLRNVTSEENRQTMLMCRRNPDQHQWKFDFTLLPEINDASVV